MANNKTNPKKPSSKKSKTKLETKSPAWHPEYQNEKHRFKAGNPGRPKGAKGKQAGFRKALLSVFDKTGGEESLLNYLTQNVIFDKDGVPCGFKYDKTGEGFAKFLNSSRYEFLINALIKTTPKTEMEDDGEEGNSYESRMNKIDNQLKSNPELKNKLLDELVDEA